MLLKVAGLRLDHGNRKTYRKPWLAKGGVSGPQSGKEPSLEAVWLQNLGAGASGGNVTSVRSLVWLPRLAAPLQGHTDFFQIRVTCSRQPSHPRESQSVSKHPFPARTSTLMLVACGARDSLVPPDTLKPESP